MGLMNTAREIAQEAVREHGSVSALAREVGINRQTLTFWLDGSTRSLHPQHAEKLARVLGIPLAAVMCGDVRICDLTRVETEPDSAA